MPLEDKINADLKAAMLAKDEASLRALRAIKQVILLAKTSGSGAIAEEEELKMLQKLVKQRKDEGSARQAFGDRKRAVTVARER